MEKQKDASAEAVKAKGKAISDSIEAIADTVTAQEAINRIVNRIFMLQSEVAKIEAHIGMDASPDFAKWIRCCEEE